jgi:ABC-type multidrug transport system fused ATPase/permease subunit
MVLSFGKLAEFDSPKELMKNPESHFTKLVNEIKKKEEKEKEKEKKATD